MKYAKYAVSAAVVGTSIGLAVPAAAADLPPRLYTKAPAYVTPLYDWSGPYVGAHIGYAWGRERDNLSTLVAGALVDRFNADGVLGGVHAGFNWQADRFVFGFEGDFDFSGVKGSEAFDNPRSFGTLAFKSEWQASVRARAGYAVDNRLFYVTGGTAFAGAKSMLDITSTTTLDSVQSSDSATLTGWTVGLGSEYAFSRNWIARAEVRYTDFGTRTFQLTDATGDTVPTRVRFNETHATVGISYKF